MILNKPKFWDQEKGFFSFLLTPISLLIRIIIYLKKKIIKSKNFNIPIICVGNIYLGGTGKTPAAILLANELCKMKRNPSIVRKFYKNHEDEYDLIREYFKNLIINKSRSEAILEAEKKGFDSVILDDGFQDYGIKKNLNIVCFNQKQLIGNGLVIPSGPLRDSLNSLRSANILIINGLKNKDFEEKIFRINKNLNVFYSTYHVQNVDELKSKRLLALAGIGNPENFFDLLIENDLNIEKKMSFPDHYQFKKSEILSIVNYAKENKLKIVMTEKDLFKVKKFNINELNYIKVNLRIENKDKLIDLINKIYV
tara:strand:+ start:2180 stop:3112 length:933 start_codon:yes stop_codon:yes gene_type:complete